jgi:hypothetical protein
VQTQIEACLVTDVEGMLNLDRPKYKIAVIVFALNLPFANIVEPGVRSVSSRNIAGKLSSCRSPHHLMRVSLITRYSASPSVGNVGKAFEIFR